MKKVLMLNSVRGADDGIAIKLYEKGKEYTLSDSLADNFIGSNNAKAVEDHTEKEVPSQEATTPVGPTQTQATEPQEDATHRRAPSKRGKRK